MDDVSVRVLRPDGTLAGLLRVIGLFTSLVYLEQASRTPLLRRKLQAIVEAEEPDRGLARLQGDRRRIRVDSRATSCSRPRSRSCAREILAAARAQEAQRITLTVRRDSVSRNITVMVAVPDDHRMSTELRIRVQELLVARFDAESVEYHLALADGAAAQLFFLLHVPRGGRAGRAARRARAGGREGRPHAGTTCSPTS